ITQEVTYETLLHQKRKELHGLVGQAIEELHRDRLEEQVSLLYRHFSQAENWPKAAEYSRRAANRAYRLGQFHEAVTMFDNAQSCLERLPENQARQKSLIDLQMEMVWPLHFLGQQDRVLEICEVAESVAEALNDRLLMGKVQYEYALSYFFKNEFSLAEQYFLKILQQSDASEMDELIASAKFPLAVTYMSTGRLDNAADLYSEVITTRETNGTQREHSQELPFLPYSHSCHHLAYLRAMQGNIKAAKELIRKGSTPEIKQISNLQSRAYCSLWHSSFSYLIGEDYGATARVDEVLEIAEKTDSPILYYLCYAGKGNALVVAEQMEAARQFYVMALQAIEGTEHRRYIDELYHNLIETTLALGDLAAAEKYYQGATPLLKLNPGRTAPRFDYLKGRLLTMVDSPDYAGADEFFQKSIHNDETNGAVVPAARTKYYRADMLARKGEIELSRSIFNEILDKFENWGIPFWQKKCEQALQTIEATEK
ncbi:MAG: tetratricopeptide repeat protein, partial [Planctomycetota bacterium]